MMHKAVCEWRDLTDGHMYNAGDQFPFDGRTVSADRIAELSGNRNKAQKRLIEAVEENGKETIAPEQKTAKRATKSRKSEE